MGWCRRLIGESMGKKARRHKSERKLWCLFSVLIDLGIITRKHHYEVLDRDLSGMMLVVKTAIHAKMAAKAAAIEEVKKRNIYWLYTRND